MNRRIVLSMACSVALTLLCGAVIVFTSSARKSASALTAGSSEFNSPEIENPPSEQPLAEPSAELVLLKPDSANPVLSNTAAVSQVLLSQVKDVVRGLAQRLADEPFDRTRWLAAVDAHRELMTPAHVPALLAIAHEGELLEDHLVAVELLRLLALDRGADVEISREALAMLRAAFDLGVEDSVLTWAAARPLGFFGTDRDRQRLVDGLTSESDATREAAVWGLQANADIDIAERLAQLVGGSKDARTVQLVMTILDGFLQNGEGSLAEANAAVVKALGETAHDSAAPQALRQRAIAMLGATGDATARDALLEVFSAIDASDELLFATAQTLGGMANAETVAALSQIVVDSSSGEAKRLAAAETIARAAGQSHLAGHQLKPALDRLGQAVDGSADPAVRRRAVFALAESRDASVLPSLARAATADPDSRVRGAAVVGLSRLDHSNSYLSLLRDVAAFDTAHAVRAQAAQAVSQAGYTDSQ